MESITFKPLSLSDFPLLHQWMQQEHVAAWWGEGKSWTLADIEEKYSSYVQGKNISAYIVALDSAPIGFIQLYKHTEPLSAGVDFYIGTKDALGKGTGAELLKDFLNKHVFPRFDACLVDPDKKNYHAIKTYAKAGFSTVQENANSVLMRARKEEPVNPIVILGSSRGDGHTLQAIKAVIKDRPIPIFDLKDLAMAYYDYSYANAQDDFMPFAEKMVQYNPIILATPVYWYSMSALMKTFIDRWTDLLYTRKDLGRRLTNKDLYVITSYGDLTLPKGFEESFAQTCDYLEMNYKGCYYFYSGDNLELKEKNTPLANAFSDTIFHKEQDMTKSNLEVAESYYLAMGEKNISQVAQYLHPDVEFVGPLAHMRGKQAVIEAAERFIALFHSLTIRSKFESKEQAMIVYDLDCPSPIGFLRGASLMNIQHGLIEKIELIYDARPFEKKKEEIFQSHATT